MKAKMVDLKGRRLTPAQRMQVVGALLLGESVTQLARRFGVSKQAISKWKKRAREYITAGTLGRQILDELLEAYVYEAIETMTALVRSLRRVDWRTVTAWQAAKIHLMLADRVIRMLELWGTPQLGQAAKSSE